MNGHSSAAFATKFWISLALTLPVLALSHLARPLWGGSGPDFPGAAAVPPVLASIVFFYGGAVFLRGAYHELRMRLPGMMTLIGIAIIAAFSYSTYATLSGHGEDLYWELTTLITIMLLGHWMEMRAVEGASGALHALAALMPDTAEVVRGSGTAHVPLAELRVGDVVIVRPGGKVSADGVVEEGESDVDESVLTGESRPVHKVAGGEVVAGSVNGDGMLRVRVSRIGEATFLSGVMRLVAQAQASKSRLQALSDRAAGALTYVAVGAGAITFTVWLVISNPASAVERMVAVLVVACPHALGLAIPLVASISTSLAARGGFLVRDRLAFEEARRVDVVLFDKTGTLTKGEYGLDRAIGMGISNDEALTLAAAVDAGSEHVIGKALVSAAQTGGLAVPAATDFARVPGLGTSARVDGRMLHVGSAAMLAEAEIAAPLENNPVFAAERAKGKTVAYLHDGATALGAFVFSDVIRPESREAIAGLKAAGIRTAMVTGDSSDVAAWVAAELGVDEFFSGVRPDAKAAKVRELQARGLSVAMVGDGVNDAPALTQANVGIAIGAGTNVAVESAGIILVRDDPRDVASLIALSRATYAKMIQNLWWATGYNVVALPLAAGALLPLGLSLEPAAAGFLMSVSTVVVALNALALRRFRT